jgi:hypothetical protein
MERRGGKMFPFIWVFIFIVSGWVRAAPMGRLLKKGRETPRFQYNDVRGKH